MSQAMTLRRLKVNGFKSIREADIELRGLNVLIGANGAGKSNFLALFDLLRAIADHRLQNYSAFQGVDKLLYFGRKRTEGILIDMEFTTQGTFAGAAYECTLSISSTTLWIQQENFYSINDENLRTERVSTSNRNETRVLTYQESEVPLFGRSLNLIADYLRGARVYHFNDTTREGMLRGPAGLNDNAFLRSDGANLPAFLYLLRERHYEYYELIVKMIRRVAPYFDDFRLEPRQLARETIRLEWRHQQSDDYFDVYDLSDGTLRFICLTTLLLQPEPPPVILIDEPELGLHPHALTLLVEMLRSASTRTQIIVSTQSQPLVSQFEPEDILVVDRDDEQSVFKRLQTADLEDWLAEYSLGELWEKNVFGGKPYA